jgi:LysM repeat protein
MSKLTAMKSLALLVVTLMAVAAAAPLSAAPAASPAAAIPTPDVPGNLLANPGFESPYSKQCCQTDFSRFFPNMPIDEVQVPQGWFGWWRQPDSSPEYPSRCDVKDAKPGCMSWHRPEWREAAPYANRIRTGNNAQKYFTFHSVHEAGMYQRVSGLKAGQRLQFSVYMSAWSTAQAESLVSEGQQTMNLRVGIDPFGGTDPFSPNIVWSKAGDSYDVFSQFTVEAVAAGNAVTAFTYSRPVYPLQHNDVYVDDAALVVAGAGSATTTTTKPGGSTATGGSKPATTSPFPGTTVDKDGNILYVIQPGDTAWSLAQRFNTTVSALAALNKDKFKSMEVLRVGKTLIVGKVKK